MGRSVAFVVTCLLIGIFLVGCDFPWDSPSTAKAASDAINALKHDLDDPGNEQLGQDVSHLNGLPSGDFTSSDLQVRTSLLAHAAVIFLNDWAGSWVNSTEENLRKDATQYASKDTNSPYVFSNTYDLYLRFTGALTDVTEDAIRGQTCKNILNLVAPNPNPNATGEPDDENWQGDIKQDASDVLEQTFNIYPEYISQFMKWNDWYHDVTNAAKQATASINNDPVPYINFLSNPAGRRATAIYIKYCYAPPTTD